ncbi:PTS mannose/fructose/sorbose/N-acetylgalactosamine transporter subunit IIC [Robertmurraya korlensis]|uniref:PTS mannose/fructose/sorbose/N-acetylgalactosamine transporter subunit IIC n=1 Tax=Robertmurraya korlensis TaxID=519977 RepID=UPI0008258473|nr:PTS sugar transporter subunit IIC [Robertmurraya korlensis]
MLVQALLIGLIAGWAWMDSRIFGDNMLGRPIVVAPLVGLVLGDFTTGVIVGGTLEIIFIGIVGVGATIPADVITGAVAGTVFAIVLGKGPEVAATLAVPISLFTVQLKNLAKVINSIWINKADKYAEEGNMTGIEWLHRGGYVVLFLSAFIPNFIVAYFGVSISETVTNVIPSWLTAGLTAGGGLLTAIGFAMIMQMILKKSLIPYFIGGFILSTYFGLTITGVTVLGVLLVIIMNQIKQEKEVSNGQSF